MVSHSQSVKPSLTLPFTPAVTTLIPGLCSTVGITDFSALCTVVVVQSTSIKNALAGKYIPMESFLSNLHFAPDNAADLQMYVDNAGNVGYKPKHQKRKITCYDDWLEANYEQTMLNYHKCWNPYKSMSDYGTLITKYEKRYHWNVVQAFDMQHRASLSHKSVNFMEVDFTLQAQVLDATAITTGEPRCHRCRYLTTISLNVPFPCHTCKPTKNTWQNKPKISLDVCSEIALDPIPVPHVEGIYPICCLSNKEHVPLHRVLQPAAHEFWHKWLEDHHDKHYRDTMYTYLNESVHTGFKGPQESA